MNDDEFRSTWLQLHREIEWTVSQGFTSVDDETFGAVPAAFSAPGIDGGVSALGGESASPKHDKAAFLNKIQPFARVAAEALGVSENLITAHAALESSWGRHPLTTESGADSFNLFGVKAGAGWRGRVANVLTSEFVGGSALKSVERFRAYPDYHAAFADYVGLLRDNPRFRGALGGGDDTEAFAAALARGGYATDPAYASKLSRIASEIAASRADSGALSAPNRALADQPALQPPDRSHGPR
ncbi:glycoside hydrolase family 73 protein [Pandoraea apista]|uniref:glycoside hydrolase family 73 protein n=1 Tax=Pandoraea apista TaxID=93218 RepID=UPI00163A6AF2|nr:glucosaminidase domain-containing protein [Pandoraea apista]